MLHPRASTEWLDAFGRICTTQLNQTEKSIATMGKKYVNLKIVISQFQHQIRIQVLISNNVEQTGSQNVLV